ncbi:myelin-associated glycoprotein isoform X2 [Electrophorus electricus]|uniref:myelin-associated glycoprotein isoform X2 n=1 Tax=Electrophorus electricus TaxID=8005 RepID=UPI000F09CDA4|nr:myelin-associated glycoprotein isoform X2 [Electrophorus electricus]
MKCLELLLFLLLFVRDIGAQWNVWMPRDISAMTNSCVVIPCTFMYPASIRPYRGIHGIWYFGQPYPQLFPPVVYKSRTEIVHESYKGRTRLLGDLLQKNCTLQISNIGAEHSGRYYFRADLGGANIYTYPDFTELKVLDQPNIDVPEEIVTDESLDLTCYAPDNCPEMSPEIHWMYTDYLPDPLFTTDFVEEGNTAVMSSTLTFTPRPMHNGQLLGCRVHYPNTTFFYERLISLDVKYAPRKVWVNVSQEVMEGNSVVLHCDVDSNPPPRISWHFKDEELMSDIASNASLYLESLTPEQEGVYTCVGDNGYGVMNTSLYLAVRYPPREPWVNGSLTVLEGTSLALHCGTQGNPAPTLTWLKDGELVGTITADEVSVLELLEIRPQADGTYRCLAENEHGRASTSLNITVEFAPILLDDSKCTIVREGVQCVCIASGNPEPSIEFYLPDLNITINETNGRFNYYTHSDGYTSTGMIKLRDKGERGNNGGTAVHVHCSITNMYGTETIRLELQQEKKYMMAVIVGTIGGVAVIAFIIAAVRYVGQNNKKENSNPGQDVGSKVENPSMFYSAVKKDKQSLRKKVGDDSDYQPVGSMAGLERQELNYAALEFMRGRPREGGLGRGDDGSDYTEIKAK